MNFPTPREIAELAVFAGSALERLTDEARRRDYAVVIIVAPRSAGVIVPTLSSIGVSERDAMNIVKSALLNFQAGAMEAVTMEEEES